jgi:hypothetical protein
MFFPTIVMKFLSSKVRLKGEKSSCFLKNFKVKGMENERNKKDRMSKPKDPFPCDYNLTTSPNIRILSVAERIAFRVENRLYRVENRLYIPKKAQNH